MIDGRGDLVAETGVLVRSLRRAGILSGIAGPVIYCSLVLILGFLQPGYNPVTQLMSELGETGAPYATVMNLGAFFLTGLLLILFASGFYLTFRRIRGAAPASALLVLSGILYIGEAEFSCDPGCIPVTSTGLFHLQLGQLLVTVMVLASFVIAYVLKSAKNWQGYWQYTAGTGGLILMMIPVMITLSDFTGLIQRILVGIILLWWEILAIGMYLRMRNPG
jgi:hypothetical protein